MRKNQPVFDNIIELPELLNRKVPAEWEDHNGHVNFSHYMQLIEQAGWPLLHRLGLDEAYFIKRRKGLFDLEHHLFFLAEIHVGDTVSVHSRLLERSEKRLHGMMFIVNQSRRQLSCTQEYITSGADLDSRRSAPFPADIASKLDAAIQQHAGLTWKARVCGLMSV